MKNKKQKYLSLKRYNDRLSVKIYPEEVVDMLMGTTPTLRDYRNGISSKSNDQFYWDRDILAKHSAYFLLRYYRNKKRKLKKGEW